jgi:hypothetical protein
MALVRGPAMGEKVPTDLYSGTPQPLVISGSPPSINGIAEMDIRSFKKSRQIIEVAASHLH